MAGSSLERSFGKTPQSSIGTEFDFGGVIERVVTRDDFSLKRSREVLAGEKIAVVGYGVQGPAQALNLRDNGFNVVVGQRQGNTYDKALSDGWVTGVTLFSVEEAVKRATQPEQPLKPGQVQYLLSDAGQKDMWPKIVPLLRPGTNVYFSHGFSYTFSDQTEVVPPSNNDATLVAPKGAGRSVREHFLSGRGINSSYAVGQDATGRALDRTLATGMAIGSGFLFETTFKQEAVSDLTGERGVLMGAAYGLWQACYNILRRDNFSPEDAALHTVEISTQTIAKIIGEKGADGLIKDLPKALLPSFLAGFTSALRATEPVFEDLYEKVSTGAEAKRVLEVNSLYNYRQTLNQELAQIANSELGQAATAVRDKRQPFAVPGRIENNLDAVVAGALVGIMHSQYELFRKKGHKPSEAFNETVEEATQSLYPLIDRNGIDWMYANCSTTAQRGALDWNGAFRDVLQPALEGSYKQSQGISQTALNHIMESEMWRAGKTVRELRPENQRIV
jgi:ketol-acid reductoisomerase